MASDTTAISRKLLAGLSWLMLAVAPLAGAQTSPPLPAAEPGLSYTNYRIASGPWSVHVVKLDRSAGQLELRSAHATGQAVGLAKLSDLMTGLNPAWGKPLAAINGDFYQMERAFAGHPRGLQIVDGELFSAPKGGVSFWLDALGQPHATNVVSRLHVTWPDGNSLPIGLNEERLPTAVVLYSSAVGATTHTLRGRELVLESAPGTDPLVLRPGKTLSAKVREIRPVGDTPLTPDTLVLSLGPALKNLPTLTTGAVVQIALETLPSLAGAKTALSGGPVLIRAGQRQKARPDEAGSYESTTMFERHPRSAVGWNAREFFLVEVDGRQKNLSVGMTLDELAAEMAKLGCTDATSFDGGGSAALWYGGEIRSSPSEGHERIIANALAIVRREPGSLAPPPAK